MPNGDTKSKRKRKKEIKSIQEGWNQGGYSPGWGYGTGGRDVVGKGSGTAVMIPGSREVNSQGNFRSDSIAISFAKPLIDKQINKQKQ